MRVWAVWRRRIAKAFTFDFEERGPASVPAFSVASLNSVICVIAQPLAADIMQHCLTLRNGKLEMFHTVAASYTKQRGELLFV